MNHFYTVYKEEGKSIMVLQIQSSWRSQLNTVLVFSK